MPALLCFPLHVWQPSLSTRKLSPPIINSAMGEYYGGLGPMVNAVLWVQVVVFAVFVGLRLYTRISILSSIGPDDYLVVAALVRTKSEAGSVLTARLTWCCRFSRLYIPPSSLWRHGTASDDSSLMSAMPMSTSRPSCTKSSAKSPASWSLEWAS